MGYHANQVLSQRIPHSLEGQAIEVIGVVTSMPKSKAINEFNNKDPKNKEEAEKTEKAVSVEFRIKKLLPPLANQWHAPGMVKLFWKNPPSTLAAGKYYRLFVKLSRPHGYANPGSFDSERHLFQKRIGAKGQVLSKQPIQEITDSISLFSDLQFVFRYPMERLRLAIKEKIQQLLQDKTFSGIIIALIIGDNSKITTEQWKILRDTGTSHLVAISGLHIGLASAFAYFLTTLLWRRSAWLIHCLPTPLAAAIAGILLAIFYAGLAGFSVSTQRAVVMICAYMVNLLCLRMIKPLHTFTISLFLVLLIDPLATLSAGFWLSFAAVAVILYGLQGRKNGNSLWQRWAQPQWVVFIGLLPLSIGFFNTTSLVLPIANIIAIPWVSFIVVPLSLLGCLLLLIHVKLAALCLVLAEYALQAVWLILKFLSQISNATYSQPFHTPLTITLAFFGMLLLLAPRGMPGKWLGLIWLLPLFFAKPLALENNIALFSVLDVGQGLSTVIETKDHVLVFDSGPRLSKDSDTGDRVVVPYLATRNKKVVDLLMISHADNDHSGGAESIVNQVKTKQVMTSDPDYFIDKLSNMVPITVCAAGQQWQWDGVQFEILHPSSLKNQIEDTTLKAKLKRNDNSCVLRVQAGNHSALITADIEAKAEKKLLEQYQSKLSSTIMLVPHHGSKTSSTHEFIDAIRPNYAVIPVGYRNQYGHPKAEVVNRYLERNITVVDSIRHGAISFVLDANQNELNEPYLYRIENQHYWDYTLSSRDAIKEN